MPAGCLLSGLSSAASQCLRQLDLGADIIVQGHHIQLGDLKLRVYTVMGAQDPLEVALLLPWRSAEGFRPGTGENG